MINLPTKAFLTYEEQKALIAEAWQRMGQPGLKGVIFGAPINIGMMRPIFIQRNGKDYQIKIDVFDGQRGPEKGEIKELYDLTDLDDPDYAPKDLIERLAGRTDLVQLLIRLHAAEDKAKELEDLKQEYAKSIKDHNSTYEWIRQKMLKHMKDKKEIRRILRKEMNIPIKRGSSLDRFLCLGYQKGI